MEKRGVIDEGTPLAEGASTKEAADQPKANLAERLADAAQANQRVTSGVYSSVEGMKRANFA